MFDENKYFVLDAYGQKPAFSSFLPGIAGAHGIPVWCYYNNRGQAVCSFGSRDKDHSIMEFSPAHVAYQTVSRTGFRTFLRAGGTVFEPFADGLGEMHIGANELILRWKHEGVLVTVRYFVLPEERVGALCRTVTVQNTGAADCRIECLDGMPAIVPYGINQDTLKNMTQLGQAWMQAEDAEKGEAFFRTRASMADSTVVTAIEGGNFALGECGGARLAAIVQPELIFGEDTSLAFPAAFAAAPLSALNAKIAAQCTQNLFPCAFFAAEKTLLPGESLVLNELYGQVETKARFRDFTARVGGESWFNEKASAARALAATLCAAAETHTANPVFDAYCGQDYLDNLLRGGVPTVFADDAAENVFYLYSRKHGDPEREYNYFVMTPEWYSQGNGNYRDVNQNRRCDVLFEPRVGDANIRLFWGLIQSDGYNPLVIDAMSFCAEDAARALAAVPPAARKAAAPLLNGEFTPGRLAMAAQEWGFATPKAESDFVRAVLAHAVPQARASFGEGYWTDHWTYNLDLIESYLSVFPERKASLLFGAADYPWYETHRFVLPRAKRYEKTENGLRQYHCLDAARKADTENRWMRTQYGRGETAQSTLAEKMVLLCAIKYATLDAAGYGVEMEGGKPGWYDALNGLPALLGSSMPESCELARLICFTAEALEDAGGTLEFYTEMADLVENLGVIAEKGLAPMARWNAVNDEKERYREQTADGVSGARRALDAKAIARILRRFERDVRAGIDAATAIGGGICPAYFRFEASGVHPAAGGLMPETLTPVALPHFLEGPTRWLKLSAPTDEKRAVAQKVHASALYDTALAMYTVNENMDGVTFEAGRARAFTRGWLENESVWLHMEYKYLLELLKSGLYPEFARDFKTAAVPFLDPAVYGRSTLENVSFLASSANPNPALHGRGFVARLSGSTAEFLDIRQRLFFGNAPFTLAGGSLRLQFAPFIPDYLMPANGEVSARFLGTVEVCYHAPGKTALVPGGYTVQSFALTAQDGTVQTVSGAFLPEAEAKAVRARRVKRIDVTIA